MRLRTLEQILKVITVAAQRYNLGDGIDLSYQYAVNRVSQEYGIAYQTIGDACRRRLRLDNIEEFKIMLKASLDGDYKKMRDVLLQRTSQSYHDRIIDFFSKLATCVVSDQIEQKQLDTLVPITVQLKKTDSDVLIALAQILGGQPEEILAEVAVEAIKNRMKRVVNQL